MCYPELSKVVLHPYLLLTQLNAKVSGLLL